jgi:hypothetical protein
MEGQRWTTDDRCKGDELASPYTYCNGGEEGGARMLSIDHTYHNSVANEALEPQ